MQKLSLVCEALRNQRTLQFFTQVLESSYSAHFQQNRGIEIANTALQELVNSQKLSPNVARLRRAGFNSYSEIFSEKSNNTWFIKEYHSYRSRLKVEYDYRTIKQWIHGHSILDFGTGDGYFSELLRRKGYTVWGTDVMDSRRTRLEKHSYSLMSKIESIPHYNRKYDTVMIKSVLHHINYRRLKNVLRYINKSSQYRVLIKEDIFFTDDWEVYARNLGSWEKVKSFIKLDQKEQIQFLALMDFFGNFVVQGLFSMNIPCNYMSLREWKTILGKHGFKIRKVIPQIFDRHMIHSGPHVWIVCDVLSL